jgi:phenylalanyl-tRNA synthetase beta chain
LFVCPDDSEYLTVKDVSRKQANKLRRSLLPSLLGVLKTNLNVQNTPCRVFEIAATFVPTGRPGCLPAERIKLGLVCDGELRDIRGVIEGLVKTINKNAEAVFNPADLDWAQAGAQVIMNGTSAGAVGIVSKKIREKFDFKSILPVAAELDFEQMLTLQAGPIKLKPIPKFPAIERDLSLVVDESICWTDILQAINKKATDELENVRFVEIYRGKGIPAGSKSVTLSLRFRDRDGTLTHDAVDSLESAIVASLEKSVGAQLRTI